MTADCDTCHNTGAVDVAVADVTVTIPCPCCERGDQ